MRRMNLGVRLSLLLGVSVAAAACASSSEDAGGDESALTLGQLGGLVQQFNAIRDRRAPLPIDGLAKEFAAPDARSVCAASSDPLCRDVVAAEEHGDPASWARVRDVLRARVVGRGARPLSDIIEGDAF